jgi:quinol monooxygenase YgiN
MTLTYEVEAGDLALFRAAVMKQAANSLDREAGCMRFEVSFGIDRATRCFVYAVFENGEALDQHLASDHFHMFEELARPWIITRIEQTWELAAAPRRSGIAS